MLIYPSMPENPSNNKNSSSEPERKVFVIKHTDLFSFRDYREYLKALYAEMKASHPFFSYRYFARIAGLGGKSYLKMVIDGSRNLTPKTVSKFIKGFKLNKKETRYFETLVLYGQSKSEEEKTRYFEELSALTPSTSITGLSKDVYEYFTDNLFVIIREMAALPNFCEDPQWIAKKLRRKVKPGDIQHAIEVLLKLKLLSRNSEGKLKHSGRTLKSPMDDDSPEILACHRRILSETKDLVFKSPKGEWDVCSMVIPIQKKNLPLIMDLFRDYLQKIIDHVNKGDRNFQEVYQISMQMMPVTKNNTIEK